MSCVEILHTLTESYACKRDRERELIVSFDIKGEASMWHIASQPGGDVRLAEGDHSEASFTVVFSAETLEDLARGRMSPLTAAGRESMKQTAPLDVRLPEGTAFSLEIYHRAVRFIQRFFNPLPAERVCIEPEASRMVHGAHVVALYADAGFRSAWYFLKPGQRLNEPGDTNPFPQAFVILSGSGRARIGNETLVLEAGNAYHVPPHAEHVVEPGPDSKGPVELIWMAWGEGA